MKTPSLQAVPAAAVLVVALVVTTASGAIAGGLITSQQIKDNNVRSVDIKDGTVGLVDLSETVRGGLAGPGALHGFYRDYEIGPSIDAGAAGVFTVSCPAGQVALGGSVDWASDPADVTAGFLGTSSYTGEGRNTVGPSDSLRVAIVCATAD